MIVYKRIAGRASDLRFAPEDYQLLEGELVVSAQAWPNQDKLPPIDTLHDAVVVAADANLAERATIDAARDAQLLAGVSWNGKQWHTDPDFQTQITGIVGAFVAGILPAGATVNVRAMDNSINALTQTQIAQLAGAVLQKVQAVYAASWAAKDAL